MLAAPLSKPRLCWWLMAVGLAGRLGGVRMPGPTLAGEAEVLLRGNVYRKAFVVRGKTPGGPFNGRAESKPPRSDGGRRRPATGWRCRRRVLEDVLACVLTFQIVSKHVDLEGLVL